MRVLVLYLVVRNDVTQRHKTEANFTHCSPCTQQHHSPSRGMAVNAGSWSVPNLILTGTSTGLLFTFRPLQLLLHSSST